MLAHLLPAVLSCACTPSILHDYCDYVAGPRRLSGPEKSWAFKASAHVPQHGREGGALHPTPIRPSMAVPAILLTKALGGVHPSPSEAPL